MFSECKFDGIGSIVGRALSLCNLFHTLVLSPTCMKELPTFAYMLTTTVINLTFECGYGVQVMDFFTMDS
jgi:hypothetical protein